MNGGGSTIYDGQLAMEFVVRPVIELPELSTRRLNRQVGISWPAWATDFQLEYATSLNSPIAWWPVEEDVIEDNGVKTVILPSTAPRMWFRLMK